MTIWDERYTSGEGLRWWPNEELVRFLGKTYGDMRQVPCRGKRAIELGCGTGCNMIALTGFGFFPYGYDASAMAVAVADEYLRSWALPDDDRWDLSVLQLPTPLPWDGGLFDLVVDCQTIQHLSDEDHIKVYAEVARILKSGGRFWSMHWAYGDADKIYAGYYPELREWLRQHLAEVLIAAGLTPIGWEIAARTYHDVKWNASWHVIEAVKS